MDKKSDATREDFEYWLFDMSDTVERFINSVPPDVRTTLDFSAASLDAIEKLILSKYPTTQDMLEPDQSKIVDSYACYVGETFRRNVGGYWTIDLEDEKNVYYGIPVLTGFEKKPTPVAPLTLVTASASRRTGKFMRTVLENIIARMARNSQA